MDLGYGARRAFRWPDAVKQKAFGLFLMGKTAAYMFDEMRVSVKDDEGKDRRLGQSAIEAWIGGWYRSQRSQPAPVFPSAHAHVRVPSDALAAWNEAWHEATRAGSSHLQPPYNIITMDVNPRSNSRPATGLSSADAHACTILWLATDRKPTYEEVRAALKKLVLKFHPDKPDAEHTPEEKRRIFQANYPLWTSAANQLYPGIAKSAFGLASRYAPRLR